MKVSGSKKMSFVYTNNVLKFIYVTLHIFTTFGILMKVPDCNIITTLKINY